MTTHIDFAALTDAEAARLMAERDGWRVVQDGERWLVYESHSKHPRLLTTNENEVNEWLLAGLFTCYPDSLDAAVGWLGRMGLEWSRYQSDRPSVAVSTGIDKRPCIWHTCYESDTCPTARALCNAGWAAVQAREAANG